MPIKQDSGTFKGPVLEIFRRPPPSLLYAGSNPPGPDPGAKHVIFLNIFIIGTKRLFGVETKRYSGTPI